MTDVERYQAALAKVNDITDRADSFINPLRHGAVSYFTDARDKIADSYDIAVKAAAYVDDTPEGKYEGYISKGEAAVTTCANLMEQLAVICRNALLDASGNLKPITSDAVSTIIGSAGAKVDGLVAEATNAVEGLGSTVKLVLYGAIAVIAAVFLFYAFTAYRAAK